MATISCIDAQKKRVEFTADSLAVAVATTDDLLTVPTEGAAQ